MIYRGWGFSRRRMIWLPHSLPPLLTVSSTLKTPEDQKRETTCCWEKGWERSQIKWRREKLVLYKSFNTLLFPLNFPVYQNFFYFISHNLYLSFCPRCCLFFFFFFFFFLSFFHSPQSYSVLSGSWGSSPILKQGGGGGGGGLVIFRWFRIRGFLGSTRSNCTMGVVLGLIPDFVLLTAVLHVLVTQKITSLKGCNEYKWLTVWRIKTCNPDKFFYLSYLQTFYFFLLSSFSYVVENPAKI